MLVSSSVLFSLGSWLSIFCRVHFHHTPLCFLLLLLLSLFVSLLPTFPFSLIHTVFPATNTWSTVSGIPQWSQKTVGGFPIMWCVLIRLLCPIKLLALLLTYLLLFGLSVNVSLLLDYHYPNTVANVELLFPSDFDHLIMTSPPQSFLKTHQFIARLGNTLPRSSNPFVFA